MIKKITIGEVKLSVFELTRELMAYDEPIPDYSSRFPNILESCLAVPFQEFSKKPLYRSLVQKAAILLYLMIKNHPFQNGNKRIAMTTLLHFLNKNDKTIKVDNKKLYNFTMWVAESPPELKKETVNASQKFIKNHLTDWK